MVRRRRGLIGDGEFNPANEFASDAECPVGLVDTNAIGNSAFEIRRLRADSQADDQKFIERRSIRVERKPAARNVVAADLSECVAFGQVTFRATGNPLQGTIRAPFPVSTVAFGSPVIRSNVSFGNSAIGRKGHHWISIEYAGSLASAGRGQAKNSL